MKLYSVFTEYEDILDTYSYDEALKTQKDNPGAMLWARNVSARPGETAKEVADREVEELSRDIMGR